MHELADQNADWFHDMSQEEQEKYLLAHPRSKQHRDAKQRDARPNESVSRPSPVRDSLVKEALPPTDDADPGSASPAAAHLVAAHPDRTQWPSHVQQLKLPPAWTDVRYSKDPHADLQAIGRDAKGRAQYVYSEAFSKSQAAAKFARIRELNGKFDEVDQQNSKNEKSKDDRLRQHARCFSLVMHMGLRPGSDDDTGAEKKAYGASTLRGEHVTTGPDGKTRLKFTGKKGVDLDLLVPDPKIARMLHEAAKAAGSDGPLFPRVTNSSLLEYAHSVSGTKTKDLRTLKGTRMAHERVQSMPAPKNAKEYKRAVREVATHVSRVLGNTPSVALTSYICPSVFSAWQQAGSNSETAADRAAPPKSRLPLVHYGTVGKMREQAKIPLHDDADDDSIPRVVPISTIRLLGFDPRNIYDGSKT